MGCGASKAGPCIPVQVPCAGKTSRGLNSSSKDNKSKTSSPKTNKAAELRRKANEAKLEKVNSSNSSTSLKNSATKCTKGKVTTCQVIKSSPTATRPKQNTVAIKAIPKNLPSSQQKTAKNTTEERSASCQSVKKDNSPSKSAKDSTLGTKNEAKKCCQLSKRPQSSPTLKKSSPDITTEAKQLSSQPSKRPTSSPAKEQQQLCASDAKVPSCQPRASSSSKDKPARSASKEKQLSCQLPEQPNSCLSLKGNLPLKETKAEAKHKRPQWTVRPKSSPIDNKRNKTLPQPTKRPQSGPPFKAHPIKAINEAKPLGHQSIKQPKEDLPKKTSAVKQKRCQSSKSPALCPTSQENSSKTVETDGTGQHTALEAESLADKTGEQSPVNEVTTKEVLKEGAIIGEGVVVENIQQSSALEAELDNFIAEVLQSQLSLVQTVPSPDKSPKPLNTRSPTTNSPSAELGLVQQAQFMGSLTDAGVKVNNDCQKSSNSSTAVFNESELINGISQITQKASSPTGRKEDKNFEVNTASPAPSHLTVFPDENTDIDSRQINGVEQSQCGVKRSSGSLKSSPSARRSQEKVTVEAKRKCSKTSINERKSPLHSTSDSNARISNSASNLRAGDSPSHRATPLKSRPSSTCSTTDASVSSKGRKSSQRPLSSVEVPPEKSSTGDNRPHPRKQSVSLYDLRGSDATKSPTPSSKLSHGQVSVASSEGNLHSLRVPSAEKKGRLTPKDSKSELKDKGLKVNVSQGIRSTSSTTLSKQSVSHNSSKTRQMSPAADKELEKSESDDKVHQMLREQKNIVKKQYSNYEEAENARPNAKGKTEARHSQNRHSTCSLPKADLEQRPKSGRSVSKGSSSSIVRSEEHLHGTRTFSPEQTDICNSSSKSSLKSTNERSGSAGSSRHSLRTFEVLDSTKTLQFSTPAYSEVQSRKAKSKTTLNKMEILNTEYEQKQVTLSKPSSAKAV